MGVNSGVPAERWGLTGYDGERTEEAGYVFVAAGAGGGEGSGEHVKASAGEDEAGVHDAAAEVAGGEVAAGKSLLAEGGLLDEGGLAAGHSVVASHVESAVGGFKVGALDGRVFSPGDGEAGFRVGVGVDHVDLLGAALLVVGGDLDLLNVGGHFNLEAVGGTVDGLPDDFGGVGRRTAQAGVWRESAGIGRRGGNPQVIPVPVDVDDAQEQNCSQDNVVPSLHTHKSAKICPWVASRLLSFAYVGSHPGKGERRLGPNFLMNIFHFGGNRLATFLNMTHPSR